ncbi:Triose phosphate/phosphate translocator [Monoraphidium neglectum]|uniref:Triose phosphate/phosphate translocator n=1 Tax=Monoraphidium neglectum TaxID=145388 RepID=A0A0D2L7S9_9CHLO|nr:Triose phosphate/phosphate translocator [Monoraphidium neglectum]KIZ02914.1 Triose phosphate/phosphate translocator [Monoraphidium neglectum]|eukprot:XP_013901933.1 Triose phosphate/phosphate translocator [Monoraphidium neglectum]
MRSTKPRRDLEVVTVQYQLDSTAEDRTKEQDPLETYGLNVYFNLLNKSILQHFPFPYTVSVVHVAVGTAYCTLTYLLGLKSWSFGRAISPEELRKVLGPASMHAVGHIAANISYAAVAISLTHTVKTMEPAFNVLLSRLVLGEATPAPVVASLLPIMLGVALASSAELSFNWTGFLSAMVSNLTFGFRAVWGKAAMTKTLDSTAVYSYTTLISLIICLPVALAMEGESLTAGAQAAVSVRGEAQFYTDLVVVGICYHLYNLLSFNTLQRVSPVSHGVTNVVKRVVIIFSRCAV